MNTGASVRLKAAPETFGRVQPTRAETARTLCAALTETTRRFADRVGMAAAGAGLHMPLTLLWSETLKFDAADAYWPDRDRFVASSPELVPLLCSLLWLIGDPVAATIDPFTSGLRLPEGLSRLRRHPSFEASGLPGGQAIAVAVGLAVAERSLAARFGRSLVDHRVWVAAEAWELAQGVTQEAAAVAGHARLERLACIVDASDSSGGDHRNRFASYGWTVKSVPADDSDAIVAAFSFARRSRKPTLIWCGKPAGMVGSPGRTAAQMTEAWRRLGPRGASARRAWLKRIARHGHRAEFDRVQNHRLPEGFSEALAAFRQLLGPRPSESSRHEMAQQLVARLRTTIPEVFTSHLGWGEGFRQPILPGLATADGKGDRNEMALPASCMNGVALHGGVFAVAVSTSLVLADQLPALRMAGLLSRRTVFLVLQGDESQWEPARDVRELPAWLRAIARMYVFHPGSPLELAECLEIAMRRIDGPSVILVPAASAADGGHDARGSASAHGGFVISEPTGERDATLISSGPGLAAALGVQACLADHGIALAVVSVPCWELFALKDEDYRLSVLGSAPRFGIDSGVTAGWNAWLNMEGAYLAPDDDRQPEVAGPQAPSGTPVELVAQMIRRRLKAAEAAGLPE